MVAGHFGMDFMDVLYGCSYEQCTDYCSDAHASELSEEAVA